MMLPDRCFNTGWVDVVLGVLGLSWQTHAGSSLFGIILLPFYSDYLSCVLIIQRSWIMTLPWDVQLFQIMPK